MNSPIESLERNVKWLKVYAATLTAVVILLAFVVFLGTDSGPGVIRAKGVIIEDEAGRERILIGAPIPSARNRVRTDEDRVRELWAPRYPDPEKYMGFYREYQHTTTGFVILDENGFDRIAIGDPVPDPNIGKRIGPSTGMVINDHQGLERSAFGLLNVQGRYRVVYGLDSDRGTEGLVLALYDNGRVGVSVRNGEDSVFLGSAPAGDALTGATGPFHGLLLKRGADIRYRVNVETEK